MCALCDYEPDVSADAAVLRTVVWLDEVKPEWRSLMSWGIMDIWDGDKCVAGQVFRENAENFDRDYHSVVANGYDYYLWMRDEDPNIPPMAFHAMDGAGDTYLGTESIGEAWLRWAEDNPS